MLRVREQVSSITANSLSSMRWLDASGGTLLDTRWPPWDYTRADVCIDETHPGPPYKSGGPLNVCHIDLAPHNLGQYTCFRPGLNWSYVFDWRPPAVAVNAAPFTKEGFVDYNNPSSWGPTGWKRFKPGKPAANLGQFIAELRDFPRLFKLRLNSFRDLGGGYLNLEFGWKPFLKDLIDFMDMTNRLKKRLDFLRRNNGKWRKRGGTLLEETETSTADAAWPLASMPPAPCFAGGAAFYTSKLTTTVHRKYWFEARMRFFIPDIDTPEWLARETYRSWGLNITPSLVYELIPWTWLVDYFSNVGDVISNMSDINTDEDLVAAYAYVMGHSFVEHSYHVSTVLRKVYGEDSGGFHNVSLNFSHKWEVKHRVGASPFGFGLKSDTLSDRQSAILIALGMDRVSH